MNKPQSFFHLHLISDATGETLLAAGRAASAQYKDARAIEHIYPLIRTEKQLMKVFDDIDQEPGIILYTVVDQKLAHMIDERSAAMGLPCVSVLEPVLTVFQSYLGTPAGRRVGAQHVLDAEYFRRIDALNFTMEHDDGQLPADIDDADIVLIGISRTSKTPTSIYLANRGIKTANIPIVLGVPMPESLAAATKPLIVGLDRYRRSGFRMSARTVFSAPPPDTIAKLHRPRQHHRGTGLCPADMHASRLANDRCQPPLDRGDGGGNRCAARQGAIVRPGILGPTDDRTNYPCLRQPVPQKLSGKCRHRL